MIRLVTDENFDKDILQGLLRQRPDLDIVRVQDVGLISASDPRVLEWAAQEGRIVLTHDRKTFIPFAYERVATGQPMPGVCVVKATAPIGTAIEYILILLEIITAEEWENQVRFVPL